jgi:hypothetical protein
VAADFQAQWSISGVKQKQTLTSRMTPRPDYLQLQSGYGYHPFKILNGIMVWIRVEICNDSPGLMFDLIQASRARSFKKSGIEPAIRLQNLFNPDQTPEDMVHW